MLLAAFWRTDLARLWDIMRAANRSMLAAAFVLYLAGLLLRAFRWRILFWQGTGSRYRDFLDAVNIGYLVNNVFPVRLGDLVRSVLLGRWLSLGIPAALSATVVERVLDSALMLAFFFALLPSMPLPSVVIRVGLGLSGGVALVLVVMLVAAMQQQRGERWLRRLLAPVPWLDTDRWTGGFSGLVTGFHALRQAGVLWRFLALSIIVWGETVLAFYLTMKALDPTVGLPLAAMAMVAAALGLAAPSAPSGLGTFEGAVIGFLLLAAVEESMARSMAITLHLLPFVAANLAGLWSLAGRGLGYRSLLQAASEGETMQEPAPPESSALSGG